ncbi:AbrB/MazE/SpoVT family DNA-binding domain-containing protein [Dehalogenimonas etheniformans]|uniref:AbrB family transcriptional regulator n=1 Tax=Dehalogenimonas etheniformans TaxID=1536648 RepID=A0A2P5PA79_9CHLR|nr:AbrB/MazE/SpoVT family DNA-binding domain-containing protein [Dehalogenimonas etheniformans]PPD59201.1 AbrB family transcriptional regulator [Dehalogenimonas etheniformans]QNT75756.1 AbrB/MazE/SpoVT family DNA-binding domain-containing protein [Dehalogenimonas etheniformans]
MENDFNGVWSPKFYGSTTIGERGQMVIPAEARKDFDITPSSKLLVFGSPGGLMVVKAENITGFLTKASEMLRALEKASLST